MLIHLSTGENPTTACGMPIVNKIKRKISEELKSITEQLKEKGKMNFLEAVTEEQIADFENKHEIAFPQKYKEWLQFSDGGECFLPAGVQFYGIAHKPLKIFSPFDALKGFNEAIASKDVLYRERIELCEDDREELNRRLCILKSLTYNGKLARENHVRITATCYVPCTDKNSEACGVRGLYKELTGICRYVDEIYGRLYIDSTAVSFENILCIESADGIFKTAETTEG